MEEPYKNVCFKFVWMFQYKGCGYLSCLEYPAASESQFILRCEQLMNFNVAADPILI